MKADSVQLLASGAQCFNIPREPEPGAGAGIRDDLRIMGFQRRECSTQPKLIKVPPSSYLEWIKISRKGLPDEWTEGSSCCLSVSVSVPPFSLPQAASEHDMVARWW